MIGLRAVLVLALVACRTQLGVDCGEGTSLVGTECAAMPVDAADCSCPADMHREGDACVANVSHYEIRIAETVLGANGHTKRQVLVFGTNADGSIATDEVILGMDRLAGSFLTTSLVLGPLGATTSFTPCDERTAGCLGPAALTLARASAPEVALDTVHIELVHTTDVSTIAPCVGTAGSVLSLDGNDFVRNGMLRVVDGQYRADVNPSTSPRRSSWRSAQPIRPRATGGICGSTRIR